MRTLLIAHRGAQTVAPENTIAAFDLAIRKGFPMLECDVQLTKDNHLVVIHDETVERTTNGKGWVSRKTLTDLRALRLSDEAAIPLLVSVVQHVVIKRHRRLIIEIKADSENHAMRTALALARFMHELPLPTRKYIEVHSFWYGALTVFKQLCPHTITAAIINGGFTAQQIIDIATAAKADGVSLGYEFLSKDQVKVCHKSGLFVDCWAISDRTVMRRLRHFGIQAIVENFTGKVLR